MASKTEIYVEKGQRRVFAGALRWPGWCRSGKDENQAIEVLIEYGPRYQTVVKDAGGPFHPPLRISDFEIVETLHGDSTTDFGAPAAHPEWDAGFSDQAELERLMKVLGECWRAFDAAAKKAAGKTLTTGPRGGGRDIVKMRAHVLEGDISYHHQLGGKFRPDAEDVAKSLVQLHDVFIETLIARNRGELPDIGPRGGKRWSPKYAIRRSAWHALDHAWEIEKRSRR